MTRPLPCFSVPVAWPGPEAGHRLAGIVPSLRDQVRSSINPGDEGDALALLVPICARRWHAVDRRREESDLWAGRLTLPLLNLGRTALALLNRRDMREGRAE